MSSTKEPKKRKFHRTGIVHIYSSYNDTIITVTDASGTSDTAYVNIALPCGSIYAQAITFAA